MIYLWTLARSQLTCSTIITTTNNNYSGCMCQVSHFAITQSISVQKLTVALGLVELGYHLLSYSNSSQCGYKPLDCSTPAVLPMLFVRTGSTTSMLSSSDTPINDMWATAAAVASSPCTLTVKRGGYVLADSIMSCWASWWAHMSTSAAWIWREISCYTCDAWLTLELKRAVAFYM